MKFQRGRSHLRFHMLFIKQTTKSRDPDFLIFFGYLWSSLVCTVLPKVAVTLLTVLSPKLLPKNSSALPLILYYMSNSDNIN